MTISAPSTPSVSVSPNIFTTEICRFCGCSGDTCKVPEGQFGFRSCIWLDKEKTVCAAPICTYKWEQEKRSHLSTRASDPSRCSKPRISLRYQREDDRLIFAVHPLLNGAVAIGRRDSDPITVVARRLGVTRQAVNNALMGKWRSKRVHSALLSAGLTPAEPKRFGNPDWTVLRGSYGTIAKRLCVTNCAIWRVANGRSYSARISAALDLELAARRKAY